MVVRVQVPLSAPISTDACNSQVSALVKNSQLTILCLAPRMCTFIDAGWSSLVARRAHNPKVVGSNPAPATNFL